MNEFSSEADSWKLIGSSTGYVGSEETPLLFKKIKENRRLLICFDEIITGLRVNGLSVFKKLNLKPDIITFGKCFGGGLPIELACT
jgi:acetylornithine/succinyldiaminopimelate/putrescine aminotransferase